MLAFIAGAAFAATIYGIILAAFVDTVSLTLGKSDKEFGILVAGGSIVGGIFMFCVSLAIAVF